jgi:hypothetical protein
MLVLNVDDYRIHRDKHRDGTWDALTPFLHPIGNKARPVCICNVCVCPRRQGHQDYIVRGPVL